MHTRYCPYCGSQNIHRVEELVQHFDINIGIYYTTDHYHECEECQETWQHHKLENE